MSSSSSSKSSMNSIKGTIHDPDMYSKGWFEARTARIEAFCKSDPNRTATLQEFQVFLGDIGAPIESKEIAQPSTVKK